MAGRWVGIDFGANYTCVSISRNNEIEVIADAQGSRTTPSCIAFTEADVIVGEAAVSQAHSNLANTVFDIKSLIGQKVSDAKFQEKIQKLPYKVVAGENDAPVVEVTYKGKVHKVSCEELVSHIISKMKVTAEAALGDEVKQAVIAVPEHFTEAQRAVVIKGAEMAKLARVCVINECTATAMAYDLDLAEKSKKPKTFVVVDLGGTRLNATVMRADKGMLTILGSTTDTSINGNNVDDTLVEHFGKEFEKKTGKALLNKEKNGVEDKALRKIRNAAENAKRVLASSPQGKIELDGLFDGEDLFTNISRAKFEAMTGGVGRRGSAKVASLLEEVGVSAQTVDQVLLVGGASKLVKFRAAMDDFFGAKKIQSSVAADEAVVIGAALEASVLAKQTRATTDTDVVAASSVTIGLELSNGLVYPMIQRGAALPAKATKKFSTFEDMQTSVLLHLCQGDRVKAADNTRLATFAVSDIEAAPRGETSIEVTVEMAENGSVSVHACAGDASGELKVEQTKDAPSAESLKKAAEEAKKNEAGDKADADSLLESLKALAIEGGDEESDSEEGDSDDEGDDESESEDEDLMLDDDLDD